MRVFLILVILLAQPSLAAEDSGGLSALFPADKTVNARQKDPRPLDALFPAEQAPAPKPTARRAPAKAAAAPELPDLDKAPKWTDILAKPEYAALTNDEKKQAKERYFDYWIAPHAGDDEQALRGRFLAEPAPPEGRAFREVAADTGSHSDLAKQPKTHDIASGEKHQVITGSVGGLTFYATLLQVLGFGTAWAIGFMVNKPAPKLWRQVAGFLLGFAIGGPAVVAAWAYGMDTLMPEIPGAFKQMVPTLMGKAIWSAVLGAGLGVYFGRRKAQASCVVARVPDPAQTPRHFQLPNWRNISMPAISLERALLAIIAAFTLAIAVRLWMTPVPVSHAEFEALVAMEKNGADPKEVEAKRNELITRVPWVWVRNMR